ncbi:hypothetical protein AP285_18940 [Limnospira platensis YZ]|nr:hypothetical protein AP285_18940 [Arthrospira platensis YZ]KDR55797.1 hypothetical protein APPUASWS_020645 [Arthrospira platensis str. Paraca]BAI92116.1 hypothetical protein NIES39_K04710 [Arthrospira platensis NIES-39]
MADRAPAPTTNFIRKNKKKLSLRPRATFFWGTLAFGRRFCYYIKQWDICNFFSKIMPPII